MTYQIKYCYCTGDSFGSEDRTEILEYEWENKENARTALKWIEEHYDFYMINNKYTKSEEDNKILEEAKSKEWYYVSKAYPKDGFYPRYNLKLKMDNGKYVQFHAPWCGYFETLYEAEVIETPSELDKFVTGRR